LLFASINFFSDPELFVMGTSIARAGEWQRPFGVAPQDKT
jgi:hypothetical protein